MFHANGIVLKERSCVKGALPLFAPHGCEPALYPLHSYEKSPEQRSARKFLFMDTTVSLLLLVCFLFSGFLSAEEYTEHYRDGSVYKRYTVTDEGYLEGPYREYYRNGSLRIRTQYRNGCLHGTYSVYDENGRLFRTSVYLKGVLAYPRIPGEVESGLKTLAPVFSGDQFQQEARTERPYRPGRLRGGYLKAALQHVKAYRFLTGVPYKDLELKARYIDDAQYGAALLAIIGRLDHTPQKPAGVPEDFFRRAYRGTSRGNLHQGQGSLIGAIDGFIHDSDNGNISHLGHRRWVLNPAMKYTGFGQAGGFVVLYAFDASRKKVPDYDSIPFPPRGYLPARYFSLSHAWNISLNPKKFTAPELKDVKITITQLTASLQKTPVVLKLERRYLSTAGYGIPLCLIFRPEYREGLYGNRFWVEVDGLKRKDGKDPRIEYLVHVGKN